MAGIGSNLLGQSVLLDTRLYLVQVMPTPDSGCLCNVRWCHWCFLSYESDLLAGFKTGLASGRVGGLIWEREVLDAAHVRSLKDEVDFVSSFGYAVYLASAEEAEMNQQFQRVYTVRVACIVHTWASVGCRHVASRGSNGCRRTLGFRFLMKLCLPGLWFCFLSRSKRRLQSMNVPKKWMSRELRSRQSQPPSLPSLSGIFVST